MAYRVEIHHAAQKYMLSIPKRAQAEIAVAIDRFTEIPRPVGCKKLRETSLWRTRVGRYRIIYTIGDEAKLITIVKVAIRREDTYKEP